MGTDSLSSFSSDGSQVVKKYFWCVDNSDINLTSVDCATVHGMLQLHSIRSSSMRDPTVCTRRHSCFCVGCIHGDWEDCQMIKWVDTW